MRFSKPAIHNAFGDGETLKVFPFFLQECNIWARMLVLFPQMEPLLKQAAAQVGWTPGWGKTTLLQSQSYQIVGFGCLFVLFWFFFPLREIYIKWAGFISKFQEETGWWGSIEQDRQLAAGLTGAQDHGGTWKDIKSI